MVQFKSRTERKVEYLGERFGALLNQELALFIGHVDLTTATISLYSVGVVLTHPNISEMKGLIVYLDPVEQRVEDGILHIYLGIPVLGGRP
jgi:hypothetical protein